MKMTVWTLLLIFCFLTSYGQLTGTLKDSRDGKVYKTINICDQTWMAENLNYTATNSWCYNDSINNCNTYGRLYSWSSAKKACPFGWHLPSDDEWKKLIKYLGGENSAGGKLKSIKFWKKPNTGATDSIGFSGLSGGFRHENGQFYYIGQIGYWWTTNEYDTYAYYRYLNYKSRSIFSTFSWKDYGLSVRCVKD